MMDDNLRLCRAQAWLWNNWTFPEIGGRLDELADRFVRGPWPGDDLWDAFAQIELAQLAEAWGEAYARDLGAASYPRPIGVDLEVVLMVPTDGNVMTFDQPTLVSSALPFVVRHVDGVWWLAGYGDFVPVPGWPPQLEPAADVK